MKKYQIGDVIGYDTKTKKHGYIYGRIAGVVMTEDPNCLIINNNLFTAG